MDGQTDGQKQRLLPPSLRAGHNNQARWTSSTDNKQQLLLFVKWSSDAAEEETDSKQSMAKTISADMD